jgi:hypothetical protein
MEQTYSISAAEFADRCRLTPYLAALARRRHHRRRPHQAKPTSSSSIAPTAPSSIVGPEPEYH